MNEINVESVRASIIQAIRTVYDPEIPVNVYDLGLIYDVIIDEAAHVIIRMTLTAPSCPEAQTLPERVENAARSVIGVSTAQVLLVWDPPWIREMMSEDAKLLLGMA